MDQNLRTLLNCDSVEQYVGERIKPGVICFTLVPYVPQEFLAVEPLSYDPASPDSRKYKLTPREFAQLCSGSTTTPPHMELGLRSNEFAIVYKAKMRPTVVLTQPLTEETQGFPSHFRNCVLCAPLYTLVDEDGVVNPNYNPKAIQGIVALKYRAVFPVLTHPYLKSQICSLRLDRILPARIDCMSTPEAKLTNRWFTFVREWVRFYATGRLTEKLRPIKKETPAELLNAARTLMLEVLANEKAN